MNTSVVFVASAALLAASLAVAQVRHEQAEFRDNVPMETYLALLAQVAPPAREGAEAYLRAFKARCGRALRTVELRRAFAEGDGNPALMAMVRASMQRDTAAIERIGAQVSCPRE